MGRLKPDHFHSLRETICANIVGAPGIESPSARGYWATGHGNKILALGPGSLTGGMARFLPSTLPQRGIDKAWSTLPPSPKLSSFKLSVVILVSGLPAGQSPIDLSQDDAGSISLQDWQLAVSAKRRGLLDVACQSKTFPVTRIHRPRALSWVPGYWVHLACRLLSSPSLSLIRQSASSLFPGLRADIATSSRTDSHRRPPNLTPQLQGNASSLPVRSLVPRFSLLCILVPCSYSADLVSPSTL